MNSILKEKSGNNFPKSFWPGCLRCLQDGKLDNGFCNLECLNQYLKIHPTANPCRHPIRNRINEILEWKNDCDCQEIVNQIRSKLISYSKSVPVIDLDQEFNHQLITPLPVIESKQSISKSDQQERKKISQLDFDYIWDLFKNGGKHDERAEEDRESDHERMVTKLALGDPDLFAAIKKNIFDRVNRFNQLSAEFKLDNLEHQLKAITFSPEKITSFSEMNKTIRLWKRNIRKAHPDSDFFSFISIERGKCKRACHWITINGETSHDRFNCKCHIKHYDNLYTLHANIIYSDPGFSVYNYWPQKNVIKHRYESPLKVGDRFAYFIKQEINQVFEKESFQKLGLKYEKTIRKELLLEKNLVNSCSVRKWYWTPAQNQAFYFLNTKQLRARQQINRRCYLNSKLEEAKFQQLSISQLKRQKKDILFFLNSNSLKNINLAHNHSLQKEIKRKNTLLNKLVNRIQSLQVQKKSLIKEWINHLPFLSNGFGLYRKLTYFINQSRIRPFGNIFAWKWLLLNRRALIDDS